MEVLLPRLKKWKFLANFLYTFFPNGHNWCLLALPDDLFCPQFCRQAPSNPSTEMSKDSCAFPGLLLAEIFLSPPSSKSELFSSCSTPVTWTKHFPLGQNTPGKAAESKRAKCHRNRTGRGEMPLGWSSASFLLSTCVTDTKVSGAHSWESAVPSGMCFGATGKRPHGTNSV